MGHKTLIGGTAYEITGGKTLVDGTAYSIKNGKTLVDGTAYEVGFEKYEEVLHLGALNFSYNNFFKCYEAAYTFTSLPADFTSANALKIGDNIYPMSSEIAEIGSNQFFYIRNCTGYPTSVGQYTVSCNMTVGTAANVYSYDDISGLDISIGII